jgi:hypothetical protein
MNVSFEETPSEESLQILACLKTAVTKALERKQRLGEYAVVWEKGQPAFIGENAPLTDEQAPDKENSL